MLAARHHCHYRVPYLGPWPTTWVCASAGSRAQTRWPTAHIGRPTTKLALPQQCGPQSTSQVHSGVHIVWLPGTMMGGLSAIQNQTMELLSGMCPGNNKEQGTQAASLMTVGHRRRRDATRRGTTATGSVRSKQFKGGCSRSRSLSLSRCLRLSLPVCRRPSRALCLVSLVINVAAHTFACRLSAALPLSGTGGVLAPLGPFVEGVPSESKTDL